MMKRNINKVNSIDSSVTAPSPGLFNLVPYGILETNQTGTNSDPVTSTIKPIDEKYANLEAERGEILVKPGLVGMYKIGGKSHGKGGTPIMAEGGSFIFSNDKGLSLDKDERDFFNFKGSSNKRKDNTPAKVLSREVDSKEYNRLMTIIEDPKSDVIAFNSAQLMLAKMQEKIGQVALVQEAKKQFKQGVPDFAQMAAPPLSKDIIESVEQVGDKMYAAQGGIIPPLGFFPPDKTGKWAGDNKVTKNPKTGKKSNTWNAMTDFASPEAYAQAVGFTGDPKDIKGMQQFVMQQYPDLVDFYHNDTTGYGQPNAGKPDDGKLGKRWNDIALAISKPRPLNPTQVNTTGVPLDRATPNVQPPTAMSQPGAPNVPKLPWEGYNFKMNAAEQLTTAAPFLSAFVQPTYYDMLIQKYTPNLRLDRLDNNQEIGNIQQQASLAQREAGQTLPGVQANAVGANAQANATRAIGQSTARVQGANTQIANQEEMYNAQAKQSDNQFNLQQIQQTFRNNILSKQRRNEQLTNGATASLNNGTAIQRNLDALSFAATSQALPFVTNEKDSNGNDLVRQDNNGNPYIQQGVPFDFNNRRMPVFNPSFGGLNSVGINQAANGMDTQKQLDDSISYLVSKGATVSEALKFMSAQRLSKGGNNPLASTLATLNPFRGQ